jgi:elongation factor G
VADAVAGDIVALPKLSATHTGDTLSAKDHPVRRAPVQWPEPVIGRALSGRSPSDEDKLALALQKICEEDPSLRVDRVDETRQTLLRGVGPMHLDVTLERVARRFHVAFDTADELVAYRETITRPAEAEGRHKKQSGGHGQFGVAGIRIEPLPRGAGFEFADEVVGGAVPKQFIPAVEKGVREAMAEGGEYGVPVVDVRVTLLDGKAHSVDSSEMAFKQAGRLALRNALAEAGPVVLEPMSEVEIEVPSSSQGDVLGDLNSRRGRVQRTEPTPDGNHLIVAVVPTAEILTYVIDLRALTGGRGTYRATDAGYDVRPERSGAAGPSRRSDDT